MPLGAWSQCLAASVTPNDLGQDNEVCNAEQEMEFVFPVDEVEDDYDCGRVTGSCVKIWSFGYAATHIVNYRYNVIDGALKKIHYVRFYI